MGYHSVWVAAAMGKLSGEAGPACEAEMAVNLSNNGPSMHPE
jgi:hypothetical protein